MDDARFEYYTTQIRTLDRIAATLERQNEVLERISLHLADIAGHMPTRDEDGALWVRMNG